MRQIDLETWPRREQFRVFSTWTNPQFSLCANVDITVFYPFVKQHDMSFTVAMAYLVARAANAIPEFRYRIRGGTVIEHAVVHPSTTVLTQDDQFTFCTFHYAESFAAFAAQAREQIDYMRGHPTIENDVARDDLLYTTSIPWVSFTSMMHPLHLDPVDCIPRFAWGRFFEEGAGLKMPLSVQAHHALVDGLHVGRYYAQVHEFLRDPGGVLGPV